MESTPISFLLAQALSCRTFRSSTQRGCGQRRASVAGDGACSLDAARRRSSDRSSSWNCTAEANIRNSIWPSFKASCKRMPSPGLTSSIRMGPSKRLLAWRIFAASSMTWARPVSRRSPSKRWNASLHCLRLKRRFGDGLQKCGKECAAKKHGHCWMRCAYSSKSLWQNSRPSLLLRDRLSRCGCGLVQPPGSGLEAINHDGNFLLHRVTAQRPFIALAVANAGQESSIPASLKMP